AIPLIQVLAVYGVIRTLHGPTGSVYLALGKPRVISFLHFIHMAVAAPLLILFIGRYGIVGAPWAILGAACVSMPVNYAKTLHELALPLRTLVEALWRPLIATAAMLFVGSWIHSRGLAPMGLGENLEGLLILIAAGALIYLATVTVLWRLA